jgi:hypothetical protein
MRPTFNRIGIVEVKPSRFSYLNREVERALPLDRVVRLASIRDKKETVEVLKTLFGEDNA